MREVEAVVTWGDYVTEPPIPEVQLTDENAKGAPMSSGARIPRQSRLELRIPADGRAREPIPVPDSAAPQLRGGGLALVAHARGYTIRQPDGTDQPVRALR